MQLHSTEQCKFSAAIKGKNAHISNGRFTFPFCTERCTSGLYRRRQQTSWQCRAGRKKPLSPPRSDAAPPHLGVKMRKVDATSLQWWKRSRFAPRLHCKSAPAAALLHTRCKYLKHKVKSGGKQRPRPAGGAKKGRAC